MATPERQPRDPAEYEASIRRLAATFRQRYPWRGDFFTVDQVECLLAQLDAARGDADEQRADAAMLRGEVATLRAALRGEGA